MNQPPFLSALYEAAVHARDLPDEERVRAGLIEALFTGSVDTLRKLEDSDLSSMAVDAWKVIEHKYVLTALHPEVPTLSMAILVEHGITQSIIFIPAMWHAMFAEDPVRQLGAVAFVCSQAVDSYNFAQTLEAAKQLDKAAMQKRAVSYEGALLRLTGADDPDSWQRDAMASEPPSEFTYPRAEVRLPS